MKAFSSIDLLQCSRIFRLTLVLVTIAVPLHGREKGKQTYGRGLTIDLPFSHNEVLRAVQQVVQNGTIQGSKEYNKDNDVQGATPALSSPFLPAWSGPGEFFLKLREHVLAPENFKDSNDTGSLMVRYVVVNQSAASTTLRIDAIFVEDFRRRIHPSNGCVELAEYKAIQNYLDKIAAEKKLAADAENRREAEFARREAQKREGGQALRALAPETSPEILQQRIQELRREVERRIKVPGAELKSAPFQSATTLMSLRPGTEVVILISTRYWYGVETEDGQHGWILRQQLEPLP